MHGSRPPRTRVVIVTLDNHLAGAVERASAVLAHEGIDTGFHAASDWDRDEKALARAIDDVSRADIVIATMLFLDDHIRAIRPALEARRDGCDAMLGLMSGGEIVRLTKMGGYRMDAPAKGPLALLKRLRGSSKPGASSGAGQMKMLRRLPKLLRFIPGTAQDVRAYFLTLQYWLAGSDANVVNMVRALALRYAKATRPDAPKADAPVEYPELGVYHPRLAGRISESADALARLKGQPPKTVRPEPGEGLSFLGAIAQKKSRASTSSARTEIGKAGVQGTVGLLMLRSYLLANDTGHYDGVIAALEARGLAVIPAFASGLDARPAIDAFFLKDGRPTVDAVVSLTGFSLVGGPAYNDAQAAEAMLARLDVPYVAAHPLEFQTLEAWGAGTQGLLPIEATMMVAIPELDGAIVPHVFGGRSDGAGAACTGCARGCTFPTGGLVREMRACPERAEALAAKVARLVDLKRGERAGRKLGIVLFNFPPNSGATGTAAFLSVWESLHATLVRLAAEGYAVEVPASVDALRDALCAGNAARFGADANVHARIAADEHVRREPHLAEIEAQWGPAPGRHNADSASIHVLGARFGNVFVGMQPAFGYEGDPMRMLFEGRFTPTHAFSAFYRWLREDFAADAVLHFGTHGALEFMPGKQTGLSASCWPERLLGDLPNFYLYASNNPSEGLLAKRRSGATLISYLTPPLAEAGLYKGLSELKTLVDRWRTTTDDRERAGLAVMMADGAAELGLDSDDPERLAAQLYELESTLIPEGLHVFGRGMGSDAATRVREALGEPALDLESSNELDALMRALDASFIAPAPGGDLIRNPAILPTGRNIHGFDPFRIPSRFAMAEGAAQADALIARHMANGAPFPASLALVLWGTDNLKSEGSQLAQALALIGARPRFDGYGRLAGAELIPLAELGRPRVDVIVTLSGIFRDLLPLQTRMIAEAAYLAASADEPLELNHVRARTLAHEAEQGCDFDTAALRVFSNAEGAYGANVNLMIDNGAWTDPDELASAFEAHKGYAYGRNGRPVRQKALFEAALAGVELAYQNLESVELGVTTIDQYVDALGGISRAVARARGGATPPVYIVDATRGDGKVRTLGEQVDLETRTRTLNPVWYEGMLRHGFEGVRHIECSVTNTMGWSATVEGVSPWVYQRISETFVLDPAMRERLATLNPKASARMAGRLIEASERKFWNPDPETLAALHAASDAIEDRLEGIAA